MREGGRQGGRLSHGDTLSHGDRFPDSLLQSESGNLSP